MIAIPLLDAKVSRNYVATKLVAKFRCDVRKIAYISYKIVMAYCGRTLQDEKMGRLKFRCIWTRMIAEKCVVVHTRDSQHVRIANDGQKIYARGRAEH